MVSSGESGRGGLRSWFIRPPAAPTRSRITRSMSTSVDQSSSFAFQLSAFPFSNSASRFWRFSAYSQSKTASSVVRTSPKAPVAGRGTGFFCTYFTKVLRGWGAPM